MMTESMTESGRWQSMTNSLGRSLEPARLARTLECSRLHSRLCFPLRSPLRSSLHSPLCSSLRSPLQSPLHSRGHRWASARRPLDFAAENELFFLLQIYLVRLLNIIYLNLHRRHPARSLICARTMPPFSSRTLLAYSPRVLSAYSKRCGRTGRAGRAGRAVHFESCNHFVRASSLPNLAACPSGAAWIVRALNLCLQLH